MVIGRISPGHRPPEADQKKIKESNIWINIDTDPEQAHSFQIKELFIYGYRYKTNAQVVFYEGKLKEQLMSVCPNQVQEALFLHDPNLQAFLRQTDRDTEAYLDRTLLSENVLCRDFDINTAQCLSQMNGQTVPPCEMSEFETTIRQLNLRSVYQEIYLQSSP